MESDKIDIDPTKHSCPVNPYDSCPICGNILMELHCKQVCSNCGFREDCTDH